jgi:hypothetical protein
MRIQQRWGGCRECDIKLKEKKRITIETQVFQAKILHCIVDGTAVGQFSSFLKLIAVDVLKGEKPVLCGNNGIAAPLSSKKENINK